MQALTKAAQAVAGRDALDVSNTTQLRDICLAAARIFGWKGESPVNVAVNNQVGVVISEAKRKELQEKLRRYQEQREREEKALPARPAQCPSSHQNRSYRPTQALQKTIVRVCQNLNEVAPSRGFSPR
jgi:hypothetical protein